MSEQLIKTPVRFDEISGIVIDGNGDHIFAIRHWSRRPPSHSKIIGEQVTKALNDHTALVAVAEAAEAYFLAAKDLPLGITVSVGEWTAQHNAKQELSAKLSAWRKQG